MKTRAPTVQEIEELVAFLPRLYAEGFTPFKQWHGGTPDAKGIIHMPYPEYHELVDEFLRALSNECWRDYDYRPEVAGSMLADEAAVKAASLDEIKSMLTYFVRGERFSDGHWGALIEGGHVRRLLERLAKLVGEGIWDPR
ncbi:MAG: DUF6508 domain-containing protein [Anaerolineae bacterium]|nr:DUF6508 domain-containing protein [Anaerolineae bacterium]